ncbi:MAG: hypothetical protein L0Z62_14990 [Gemmataceae bacterium]|nr:hypothetical protein [Gemmataceae bacterium]
MTEPLNNSPVAADEQRIEKALREILCPLDRRLGLFYAVAGLCLIVGLAAVFLLTWLVWDWAWWAALLWAGGGFVALAVVLVPVEALVMRPAVRDFHRRFPEDGPERALALHLLQDLESPNKAEEKLHAAVTDAFPTERIVRKGRLPSFVQVEAALRPFRWGGGAPAPDQAPHVAPGPPPGPPASDRIVPPERLDPASDEQERRP